MLETYATAMLLKKGESPQKKYDCVVIGSGLGGLTCANLLAQEGKKVLLLESHNKLGGLATWFYRKNEYLFDISLHGFPKGMLKSLRKYWGNELSRQIIPLKRIRFQNPQFELETTFTREDFTQKLKKVFLIPEERIQAFFDHLFGMNFYDDQNTTTRDLFERFFPGRNDVMRFLLEPMTYANGSTPDDPAISFAIVLSNFLKDGVYTYDGGTDLMIKQMRQKLIENGVDIKLHSKVEKIVVKNKKVQGVLFKDTFVESPIVVSNAHLWSTIFSLVGAQHFSKSYCLSAQKVRINSSSCQVYMAFKKGLKADLGDLLFTSTTPTYDPMALLSRETPSRTYSIYYPELRPERSHFLVVASSNAHYSDWSQLDPTQYKEEKLRLQENTLKHFKSYVPNVHNYLDHVEVATPLTVEKFTQHPRGASFGTKFEGLQVGSSLPKEVEGLYHTGSVGIIMSGWLGAANHGAIVAHEINRKKENHAQL